MLLYSRDALDSRDALGRLSKALVGVLLTAAPLRAHIYQWEDTGDGRVQSTTLTPGGGGVDAVPGEYLYRRDLTKAYLIGADLTGAYAYQANFTDADFTNANLTSATLSWTTLTGATFTDAVVRGAGLNNITSRGFGAAQLYSTASYQAGDLSGILFDGNNLTGWDFSSQDLSRTRYYGTILAGVDFTGATITGAILQDATSNGFTVAQFYSTASYQNLNLREVWLNYSDLTGWNFAGQDLTGASLQIATLLDADFTGAIIDNASFYSVTNSGFTAAQLYSTASYQAGGLRGVNLEFNDMSGWNFAGIDLTGANFNGADLAGSDLTGAIINDASLGDTALSETQLYSTASYQAGDLSGTNLGENYLSDVSFAGFNLERAGFGGANLEGTDFTGANIRGANFYAATFNGFTPQQLYSTASYQEGDLSGVSFLINDLAGWDFEEQNLQHAELSADLTGTNLRHAYLVNAVFDSSGITNIGLAIFHGADARGARMYLDDTSAGVNLIGPQGVVHGIDLTTEELWIVRDYDGDSDMYNPIAPIAIHVEDGFSTNDDSTIEVRLEADAWDSTISFEPGIAVTLDGTLELSFTPDVDVTGQVGRSFALFDWTGVAPTGAFNVVSEHEWDLSSLYTTGVVTLTSAEQPLYGDYNGDGAVDAADYTVWRDNVDAPAGSLPNDPGSGPIGAAQYETWRDNYGRTSPSDAAVVPEPATAFIGLAPVICAAPSRRRQRR
ncbi:pentapeptide repeat-containing protein [Botrimarina mediterranea]|uniref:Secreted effector protein pipB2 n=1 Tax=Botrimarina mediterranea TaxID=2528022 RepID=A0A518K3N6_9BACT|nr:pentapeptide repeat-containing protein [Botrimarina mediterranea]QDV72380.1 Secreted effector protein pipB2 [Botrimarina mediterranea]QDV76926.1 Secreted effector protein pipB2 [Planctomycetes bacterium K2D]